MLKNMPRRRAELRKELETLNASARKKPGDSRWRPLIALTPDSLTKGKRYVGWICKGCGKRLEHQETTHETPEPVNESSLPWVRCPCGRVDRYPWNARTIEVHARRATTK
jgi:RNase P subunit RPR2